MRDRYYSKEDKKAIFFPQDWEKFWNTLKEKQKPYFAISIATGGRIEEIRNVTPSDINHERNHLKFRWTKKKVGDGNNKRSEGRTIKVSKDFCQWIKRYERRNKIGTKQTFKIPSTPGINKLIKTKAKEIGMENWKDLSSHNIRKTHGNWLKAIGVDWAEISVRLGHDPSVMTRYYLSPNLFNDEDCKLIKKILGDIYETKSQIPNKTV